MLLYTASSSKKKKVKEDLIQKSKRKETRQANGSKGCIYEMKHKSSNGISGWGSNFYQISSRQCKKLEEFLS